MSDPTVTAPTAYRHLQTMDGKAWRPQPGRPYLKLCKPCNRRAAEAGRDAELIGVEVCLECAAAIDRWQADFAAWQQRRARNKRKASKRRARLARRPRRARR